MGLITFLVFGVATSHFFPEEGMDKVYDHGHLSSSAISPVSLLRANEAWYNVKVGVG